MTPIRPSLTMERVTELRRLAEKATPGEWVSNDPGVVVFPEWGGWVAEDDTENADADAAYIAAANPATILALLDHLQFAAERLTSSKLAPFLDDIRAGALSSEGEGLDRADIEALERALRVGFISWDGDGWYAADAGFSYEDAEAAFKAAGAVLTRLSLKENGVTPSPQEER